MKENDLDKVPPPVQNVAHLIAASSAFLFSPYPRPPPPEGILRMNDFSEGLCYRPPHARQSVLTQVDVRAVCRLQRVQNDADSSVHTFVTAASNVFLS